MQKLSEMALEALKTGELPQKFPKITPVPRKRKHIRGARTWTVVSLHKKNDELINWWLEASRKQYCAFLKEAVVNAIVADIERKGAKLKRLDDIHAKIFGAKNK